MKIKHFRHEYSSILCKFRKKRNKIKWCAISCSYIRNFNVSVLFRYTICEILVKIQYFRHENSSTMYANTQKRNQRAFHNLQSHLSCQYIKKRKFCEDMCYQTQIPLIFVMYFSGIGQSCRSAQKNGLENQKSSFR